MFKIMQKMKYLILSILVIPNITFAAWSLANSNFSGVIDEVLSVFDILRPILGGLAFVVFFWGLSKFILNANKPEEIKNGRNYMLGGILVLFILLTFTVLIGFVSKELEIGGGSPLIPSLKTTNP
jgi:hypothetical protein